VTASPSSSRQPRPFLTLGIVVLVWLLVPTAIKRFTRSALFEAQAPVATAASRVRDLQEYWELRTRPAHELIAAGQETSRALARHELGVARLEQLESENARLRALLAMPSEPGWRYERARVIERDFSAWWQQLVIRKGADYGIPVDAPVVFAGGVVGRVREVRATTSVVALLSDSSVRIAVVLEGEPAAGARPIQYSGGDNPSFGSARGALEFVPTDITIAPNAPRRLLTSGLGGVFPAGLAIGWLTRVEPSPDGLFQTGEVRLDSRLSTLDEVTVLVPETSPGFPTP
jgi:rod shape-determining protein MreC